MVVQAPEVRTHRPGHITPETVARWADAVRLRTAGATYDDIAKALGLHDRSAARKAVRRGLREAIDRAGIRELRALEAERIDRLQLARWQAALDGDDDALALVLRIIKLRIDLLGLNAPVKLQHQGEPKKPAVVMVLNNVSVDDLKPR